MKKHHPTSVEIVEKEVTVTKTVKVLRIPVSVTVDLTLGKGRYKGHILPTMRSLWIRGWAYIFGNKHGERKLFGWIETDDPEVIESYMNQYNNSYGEHYFPKEIRRKDNE